MAADAIMRCRNEDPTCWQDTCKAAGVARTQLLYTREFQDEQRPCQMKDDATGRGKDDFGEVAAKHALST